MIDPPTLIAILTGPVVIFAVVQIGKTQRNSPASRIERAIDASAILRTRTPFPSPEETARHRAASDAIVAALTGADTPIANYLSIHPDDRARLIMALDNLHPALYAKVTANAPALIASLKSE